MEIAENAKLTIMYFICFCATKCFPTKSSHGVLLSVRVFELLFKVF